MHVIFLGTASCFPTKYRGVSCTAVQFEDGDVWFFDCGEGTQVQLQKSNLRIGRVGKIFITHLHGDHLFGLPGMICTLGTAIPDKKDFILEIYGPQGLRKYVRHSLNLSRSPLPFSYIVHELIPVEQQFPADWSSWTIEHVCHEPAHPQEIIGRDISAGEDLTWDLFTDDKASVKAGAILHRVPTFGYVIVEKDQPGQLDIKLLQQLGATPGPLYSKLKTGETVTFSNGVVVQPSEVLGPPKRGRKLTILGDTHDPSMMSNLARDSDALIHEATMEDALKAKAIENGHSTPSMAAEFARSVGARMLILNHFSQRYKGEDDVQEGETKGTILQLLEEAKCALADYEHCTVMVADDGKVVDVPRCHIFRLKETQSEARNGSK